jgi:protein SCO1/2/putative membrane protein
VTLADFPHLNAALNALSAVLIVTGLVLIRRGRFRAHAAMMIAATITSTAFLVCYLIYHAQMPPKSFAVAASPIRTIYFGILLSHTLLAAVVLPLVLISLWRAYRRQWEKHRRIGPWTSGVWLYVSITGVIIYWMLYHLWP